MRRTENANLGTAVSKPATDAMAVGTEVVAGVIEAAVRLSRLPPTWRRVPFGPRGGDHWRYPRKVERGRSWQQTQGRAHRLLADHGRSPAWFDFFNPSLCPSILRLTATTPPENILPA